MYMYYKIYTYTVVIYINFAFFTLQAHNTHNKMANFPTQYNDDFDNFVDRFCEKFAQRMKNYIHETKKMDDADDYQKLVSDAPVKILMDMNYHYLTEGSELVLMWEEVLEEMCPGGYVENAEKNE